MLVVPVSPISRGSSCRLLGSSSTVTVEVRTCAGALHAPPCSTNTRLTSYHLPCPTHGVYQGKYDGSLLVEADGLAVCTLLDGEYVSVTLSNSPVPFFLPEATAVDKVWLDDVMHMLQWNRARARTVEPKM